MVNRLCRFIVLGVSLLVSIFTSSMSARVKVDTIGRVPRYHSFSPTRLIAPAVLMGGGLFAMRGGDGFFSRGATKSLRDQYAPNFHTGVDDYLGYLPALAFYSLKFCGVPSRSNYGEGSANLIGSYLLAQGMAQFGKMVIDVERPDKSNNNSFPSGHTTTAFALAHFLHKEFGDHSPYISLAGYGVASSVGVCRILNDKHWLSDVLFGAGLGIFATEMAYLLSGMIFTKNNVSREIRRFSLIREQPSFARLKMAYAIPCSPISYDSSMGEATSGFNMGAEAAFFLNSHYGLGVETLLTSFRIQSKPQVDKLNISHLPELGTAQLLANFYYNRWLGNNFAVIAKVGTGVVSGSNVYLSGMDGGKSIELSSSSYSWAQTIGITGRWLLGQVISLDMVIDYYNAKLTYNSSTSKRETPLRNLSFGVGLGLFF